MSIFAPTASAARAHHSLVPHWLMKLGPLGLFLVSIVDSSPVPLPVPGSTDLLLLWLLSNNGNPWLLAPCALAGSLLGGVITWGIGRKGGEAALHKYVPARLHARIVSWVQRRPILAVFVPAVLPPPIPLSPFILAAGALDVPRGRFLLVFGSARTVRYGLIAWLGVTYGRGVVRMWSRELQEWSTPLLSAFFVVLAAGVCFAVWKSRANRRAGGAKAPSDAVAARAK